MRTIVVPLYIHPVRVTEKSTIYGTSADRKIRYWNIMTWKDKRYEQLLAYFLDDRLFNDHRVFACLVEKIGYSPFLEIASLDGMDGLVLHLAQPDEVPRIIVDSLFSTIKPHLEEFRPRLQALYGRSEAAENQTELKDLILDCWREAYSYGFAHHFTRDRNGLPVHIIEGRDVRAGALIGLAQHLERRGSFPESPTVQYCDHCRGPKIPWIYQGRRYCSDACRRAAARTARSRLVNRIQTKSRRMVKRGELTAAERDDMLREIKGKTALKAIEETARRYGVDPTPARAGRKARDGLNM